MNFVHLIYRLIMSSCENSGRGGLGSLGSSCTIAVMVPRDCLRILRGTRWIVYI